MEHGMTGRRLKVGLAVAFAALAGASIGVALADGPRESAESPAAVDTVPADAARTYEYALLTRTVQTFLEEDEDSCSIQDLAGATYYDVIPFVNSTWNAYQEDPGFSGSLTKADVRTIWIDEVEAHCSTPAPPAPEPVQELWTPAPAPASTLDYDYTTTALQTAWDGYTTGTRADACARDFYQDIFDDMFDEQAVADFKAQVC